MGLLVTGPAWANSGGPATAPALVPAVRLSVAVGPPTTAVKAAGSGFPAGDAVSVAFGATKVASATASSAGTFTARFRVPASAVPGPHTVTASGPGGLGASAVFTVRTSWVSARFSPTGSGFNPYENVLGPANVRLLRQVGAPQWGAFLHSEPIYVGGKLIAGSSDGTVREFDPTGDQQWSFTARGPILGSPAAAIRTGRQAPCAIAAGSGDGNLYGLNPLHGTLIWTLKLGRGPVSGSLVPVAQFGPDLVGAADGGAIALVNGCTGKPAWAGTLALGSAPPEPETPVVLPHVTLRSGKVRTIIVISTGAGTSALNAGTGTLIWTAHDPCTNPPCSPLAYGAGTLARVVVGTGDPTAVELNAATGQRTWSARLPAPVSGLGLYEVPVPGSPARFTVRFVIVADKAGDLEALNPRTGAIRWRDKLPGPAGEPAIANGVIYDTVGPVAGSPQAAGQLIAVNGDGRLLFSSDTGDLSPQPYPPAPPTIADGRVYVGDFTGGMRVFALIG